MSGSSTYLPRALTYVYADTSRLMRSSKAKADIRVYVEDEGDIMFWRQFLSHNEGLYNFKISVYHCIDRDIPGKDCIMKAVQEGNLVLHSHMLACLDADYDLIIDDYHKYTDVLRSNPYIVTTHWYAIENIKADPKHLSEFYNSCTLSENCSIDFGAIVEDVSIAYYDLLLRLILCQSKGVLKSHYTIDAFGDDLKNCMYDDKNRVSAETHRYIAMRIAVLNAIIAPYSHELTVIKQILRKEGFNPRNCYRVFKGHHWVDMVIVPLLTKLVDNEYQKMVLKKLSGVPDDLAHKDERRQIIEHYNNNVGIKDDNVSCKKARITRLISDQIHNEDIDITPIICADLENAIKRDQILSIVKGLKINNK